MEAESGELQPPAEERGGTAGNHRRWERQGRVLPQGPRKEHDFRLLPLPSLPFKNAHQNPRPTSCDLTSTLIYTQKR